MRGFIAGGWSACRNREGTDITFTTSLLLVFNSFFLAGDLSHLGQLYSISLDDFERDILPNLHEHDCVIRFEFNTKNDASSSDVAQLENTMEK